MELMKIYLDTTAINSFLFGVEKEPDRYAEVAEIFHHLKQKRMIVVISFYALLEIFWFCVDNFPENEATNKVRKALLEILSYEIELIPLLKRSDRLQLASKIIMSDSSDIPHAMMAYIHNCDYIVTYDSQFESVSDWIKFIRPKELNNILRIK